MRLVKNSSARLVVSLSLLIAANSMADTFLLHRSNEYGFSIGYPSNWKVNVPHEGGVLFSVSSPDGLATCSVVHEQRDIPKNTPDGSVAEYLTTEILLSPIMSRYPDVKVEKSGKTFLGNQEAFFTIATYKHRALGRVLEISDTYVMTNRGNVLFTVGCSLPSAFYDTYYAHIEGIISSVVFSPLWSQD